jgi:hypothetical protein
VSPLTEPLSPASLLYLNVALNWTGNLVALAITLQSIELLQIRRLYSDSGIWQWSTLRSDFKFLPKPIYFICNRLFTYYGTLALVTIRLIAALLFFVFPHALLALIMFINSLLICIRWRGTYNGGSDYMTIQILGALTFAHLFKSNITMVKGGLIYIAVQSCISYTFAGYVKIVNREWRTGEVFKSFFSIDYLGTPAMARALANRPTFGFLFAWITMIFECLFPIIFFKPQAAYILIPTVLVFHLGNFLLFGLNRFLFAWIATYPALFWYSQISSF